MIRILCSVALFSAALATSTDARATEDVGEPAVDATSGEAGDESVEVANEPQVVVDDDPWALDLPDWFELDAEYRARTSYINPLELSGTRVRSIDWTEQRLRLGFAVKRGGWLALRTRFDILDGVLFGDNGEFFSDPSPISGISIASRRPNETALSVGLRPGADPLDPEAYEPTLTGADAFQVDHVYADVVLPFGLLRVGRQPANYGANLGGHDGERHNRWGVSNYGDIADRFLFGTKLDEAVRMIRGDGGEVDASLDDGVILATWLDLYNTGDLYQAGDNLRQNGLMLTWARSEADWGGWRWRDFALTGAMVRLANDDFDTGIWAMPFIARARVGPIGFEANVSHIRGATRELSEGMSVLNPRPAASQKLRSLGARAIVDWTVGPTTLTFEFDYASGDDDPRQESDLTSFSYPRDLNVGLLLFERILAFESARRAAVGVENLHNLSAPSFPLTEVSTETRFTNALALFPQVNVEWIDRPEHLFSTRFGVLLAWPAAAGGAVDPVMTSLSEDGERIDDDAVNFHGGDPGSYYGTEFDFQLRWAYRSGFFWTVESAALLPGSSLRDENNDAVPSFMVENRFEFVF